MGFGGISIWQLLIVLAIVILIFGTKRLKGLGNDVGGALKSFKKAMNEDESADDKAKTSEEKAALEQKDAQFAETESKESRKETDKSAH
ncbi:MAG: twin-arginine translocase TatA/TatE family subunit [Saccharospirillum sp.]|nr:twin-arginine translocase TatA/TatE family subunit [Saccharospirillum sp.]